MTHATPPARQPGRGRLIFLCGVLAAGLVSRSSLAEDWGAYSLVPASAPNLVLEAVGSGTVEGTIVSIGKRAGSAHQKWVISPRGKDVYAISPMHQPTLVLAASKGGTKIGTLAVLETDRHEPWQEWNLKKNEDGSYTLIPRHAPGLGLDLLGGKTTPGAKVDLWENKPNDAHLQWAIKPLAGSVGSALPGPAETGESTYVAPEIKPEDIPQGVVKSGVYTSTSIFPGTSRQVVVFIPAQYDGTNPACVSVKTDGYNPREKALLETLIASKEIPITIGVFIPPGDLPAPVKNTMGRRNRCLEYDGMGDANVNFLIDEVLPWVARSFDLKLSTSGNDRCISGGSSGGIAAFNAAWERPDAFSRVYANSGSFVAFRGGHEFPTLVRKFEAKPIRAFLPTGVRDMENCAGDWYLIDQEMDKALKFSGYDYQFRTFNGGHVAGYYDVYQEAMSYLWKGWPEPVKAGPSAPRVRDIILPDEPWRAVAGAFKEASGPACNARGEVFFVDTKDNTIQEIDIEGKIHVVVPDAGQANSLAVGPEGQLYAVSRKTGKILSYDPTGKSSSVAEGIAGDHLLAMPSGGLYVTGGAFGSNETGSVWYVKDGKTSKVDSGLKSATGLAYRPDQWLLSVADGRSKWAYSYQINADGTLANKERYFWLHVADGDDDAGAESVCYAREGPMLVGTRFGVQICADDGPTQVILPVPNRARVVGLCFGGPDLDTLYAFCGSSVWKRKVKVHGIGAFSPFTRAHGSHL